MKKILYLFGVLNAVLTTILIPQGFIHRDFLIANLDQLIHLKVDPRFSGGEIIGRFMDRIGDDHGEGGLTYPLHPAYLDTEGCLDLVRYTVYEPLTNAPWSDEDDYWQFAFTFSNMGNQMGSLLGFSHPVIHLYIDIDGKEGGSLETADPRSSLVRFDEEHPWDFFIHIDGFHEYGTIRSYDGLVEEPVIIYVAEEKKTIVARVLLTNERIKQVLDRRTTFHYVLIGAYDPFAQGLFMPVKEEAGIRNGGGAASKLTPRIFDYLAPENSSQEVLLQSYDEGTFQYAAILPVEVTADVFTGTGTPVKEVLEEFLKRIEAESTITESPEELLSSGKEGIELAEACFQAGYYAEAEKILDSVLEKEPGNILALAYMGSIIAIKGGEADSITMSVQYVYDAFSLLDTACETAFTDSEKITSLLCRGHVCLAVPENVFLKSRQGALDFQQAAEILAGLNPDDIKTIISCYFKAGQCYENTGAYDDAEIMYYRAFSLLEGLEQ
jgi:hypothetical protein